MRPVVTRRSSFALVSQFLLFTVNGTLNQRHTRLQTEDIFLNGDIEIVVESESVKLFFEKHWRSRKFRVVVDFLAVC